MIQVRRVVSPVVFLLGVCSFVLPQSTNDAIERRIDALLQQMTVQEKAGQVTLNDGDSLEVLERVKEGQVGALLNVLGAEKTNAAQRLAVEQSRLKIPLLFDSRT
jgi:beta-glucosidase